MKKLVSVLILSLSISDSFGCAKKKVKPEAESNESRKSRQWDYDQVNKNLEGENAEAKEHADCEPIKTGKYANYYQSEKHGRHLTPHHNSCQPVDDSKGLGPGFYQNEDLPPHKIGHGK